jgi:Redoxin
VTGTSLEPHVIRRRRSPIRRIGLCVATVLSLIGCGTGTSAVAVGDSFEFVAPGGQTRVFYDPPASRGRAGEMSAESVTEPGRRVSLSDFAGQVVVVNIWGSWCGPCREEAPPCKRYTTSLGHQV